MTDGVGANPIEAQQGGERAETLANAMAGIADMYDELCDDARARTHNSDIANGFNLFKNSTYQTFIDVQEHGVAIADRIQEGAGSIAQEDWENSQNFQETWAGLEDLNVNH